MTKKTKRWSALVLALAVFVQAAFTGMPLNVQAAESSESESETHKDLSEPYYYDLASGDYYLAGQSITVNGEAKESGSALEIPGEYRIQRTSTNDRTLEQDVVLYRRGDVHPDGNLDAKDLVALKKYQEGEALSEAGAAAVELTDDPFVDDEDSKVIRRLIVGDTTLVEDGDWKNYKSANTSLSYKGGTDAVMPIGGFMGPALDETTTMPSGALGNTATDAIYKLVSDAGINLVTTTPNKLNAGTSVETVMREELTLAEKYGIDMYVNLSYLSDQTNQTKDLMKQYLQEYSSYTSFKGISLGDEPIGRGYAADLSNAAMDAYSTLGQLLHGYTNLTGYTNLLPWWSTHGTEEQYKAYLQEYITAYNPKQISLDYYVWGDTKRGSNASKEAYFKNLAMIKEAADDAGIPFWIVCQAGGYFSEDKQNVKASNYYPTEGETLWNVNTALAYGAQGITYYPLVQPVNYSKSKNWLGIENGNDYMRNGLIGADGNTTSFYNYAKRANTQILSVDHVLMQAQNQGIMATAGSTAASEVGTVITNYKELQSVGSTGTAGAIAGCFDYLGTTALYVVNYDASAEQTVTLNFDKNYTLAVTKAGETSSASTTGSAYAVTLTAGEGALVLVNDPTVTDNTEISKVGAAIDALPDLADSEMPRDYTNVIEAKKSFDALNTVERAQITEAQKNKLNALYQTTTNYGVVYEKAVAGGTRSKDSVYGNVTVIHAANAAKFDDNLVSSQIDSKYGDVIFYVYNPTDGDVEAAYGTSSHTLKANAWTKVTVPVSEFTEENDLTFASPVSGEWKVTDYYGLNSGDLLERVIAMIDTLPDPILVKLTDKESVAEARVMYDALDAGTKASVTNYQKLADCEERIEILEAEAEGILPVVIDVAERAYGIDNDSDTYIMDETYGIVMGFEGASYFAIHKDQMTDAYKAARMAMVYIYNPTDETQYVRTNLGDDGGHRPNFIPLYSKQWNRVELFDRGMTEDPTNTSFGENYLTAGETIYFYATDSTGTNRTFTGEGWKVSSVYGVNDYSMKNVEGCEVVLNVTNVTLGGTGTDGAVIEDSTFGNVWSFSSATSFALTDANKSQTFRLCKDVATYIYNPTDTAVVMSLTTDWAYYEYFQLQPKAWNRILLADFLPQSGKNMISTTDTIWFDAKSGANTFPAASDGSKWMISNFYGMPVTPAEVVNVEALLTALKNAEDITSLDDTEAITAVEEARTAYDALSATNKTLISAELVAKLEACEAKIKELNNSTSLADKIAGKVILDASIPNMTFVNKDVVAVPTTSADNALLGTVATMGSDTAILVIEPSRQSEAYKNAEKLSFWIYNPTDTKVSGYYTMDWVKNVNITLESKAWTRIDMDDTSVDQFLTGGKTIYYYINNNNPLGAEGWQVSSFYGDLSTEEISAVDTELYNMTLTLAERLETKVILDAAIPNMTFVNKDVVAVPTTSADNALLGTVATMGSDTAILVIEPSRQSEAYKNAEKLSFWIYNPTDTKVSGYYTMDWVKNVNITLESKAWTRIDMDDTSVDQFLTGGKTIYYYINNNNPLGAEGWQVSSFYGDVSSEDITAIEEALAQQSVTIADIISEKIILDAAIPNMSYLDSSGAAVSTTSATNEIFGTVVAMPTNAATLAIEPSRQSEAYKNATQLSFWIYNPTDTKVSGYYTMDWSNNVNITLESKAWTRVDMDDMSVDQFLTQGATIYYYIYNNNSLGAEGWLMSSVYGDLTAEEIVEVEKSLTPLANRIAQKVILDASVPNMTIWDSSNQTAAITAVSSDVFGTVAELNSSTSTVIVEGTRKSSAYKGAEKISFWIYNPTDRDVKGYYTMDWSKNASFTLVSKAWTRIDVDDSSVDAFLTSNSTVYFYLCNGSEVGTTGWLMSSFYGDLTEDETTEITNSLK